MAPLRDRLGQTIRELRAAAGFSQEGFADRIGVHRTSMSSIERGILNVRLDTLEQLATGLEIAAWELLRIAEVGSGGAEASRSGRGRQRLGPYPPTGKGSKA
jgi:transcriptional regulator with XRE-family HTH domain